jgi:hypothetical protein
MGNARRGEGGIEVTDMRSARRETLRDFFAAVSILIAAASAVFTGMQLRDATRYWCS